MCLSIKINTATMIRNIINKSIQKVIKLYTDNMYWYKGHNSEHTRRLTINNLTKFEHWLHDIDDERLVELAHKPGMITTFEKFPEIITIIILSENERWIWKPRYILSLMMLISYVVGFDWCNKHYTGVIARGIMRMNSEIRVGEYIKTIHKSRIHREKIMEIYNEISHI